MRISKKQEKACLALAATTAASSPLAGSGARPWEVVLKIPPSDNGLYLNVRGRGRVKTPKYRKWISDVLPVVQAMPRMTVFPVAIDITVVNGKGWRSNSDIQNRLKSTPDILVTAGILPDDKVGYVVDVRVRYDHNGGKRDRHAAIVVRVSPVVQSDRTST